LAVAHGNPSLSTPHLSVRGLRKVFSGHVALQGIDLDVAQGEFIALLGPSGCGKTTLLRCIAGLVAPTEGDIEIDGRSIVNVPVHRRDLGMAFQSYALFPHMSVAENVGFGLRMRGVGRDEIRQRVMRALDLVRLQGMEGRYPHQLSGGQQQRVATARAIVTDPKVLLLDEPLGALDAKLREAMQVELRQLQRRLGVTTIFVTHDQHEALGMADRVAVMRDGRIDQFDAPGTIYDQPRTAFVADFIGQTNQFKGDIVSGSGAVVEVQLAGQPASFTAERPARLNGATRVAMMIRPERIELATPGSGAALPNQLEARISDVLFSGEKITVLLKTPIGPLTAAIQNRRSGELVLEIGQAVRVGWHAGDALLFPE
jgi:spermidine/putrescine transport system ATP-binding protein